MVSWSDAPTIVWDGKNMRAFASRSAFPQWTYQSIHDGVDWDFVVEHAPLVIDTRNATRDVKVGREKIVKA